MRTRPRDGFLERFLANFEGFYTVTEERIEHSSLLLDARTVPAADLCWLACWFGLVLDPQWNEAQRRFLVRNVDRFYRWRGTPAGLLATLRTYLDPGAGDSAFGCGCAGDGGMRIVERFLARDGGGAAHGDPAAPPGTGSEADRVAASAHRFDVLVPAGLSADTLAMIERIVAVNKPAHTLLPGARLLRPVHRRAGPPRNRHPARQQPVVLPDGRRPGIPGRDVPGVPPSLRTP